MIERETILKSHFEYFRNQQTKVSLRNNNHDKKNIFYDKIKGKVNYRKETLKQAVYSTKIRSSRPEVCCKSGVLRNFTKFKGKHLCQSLFFNKVAGLTPATLLKKRIWHRCFPVNLVKFPRIPFFFKEHLWWLLLKNM